MFYNFSTFSTTVPIFLRDKDNAKYYAIGRDVTARLGAVTLSVSLFDLYRYGYIKFKKPQKVEKQ